jgi:polysaccharide biosynthesis/export protein
MSATVFPHLFRAMRGSATSLVLGASLALAGCSSPGTFVWYRDLPNEEWKTDQSAYVIGVGDSISIRVYEQEGLSSNSKIRRDGKFALPLAGELMAAGKHPQDLAREIEGRLKEFIVTPRVTINVEQSQPITVTAIGEISHIGSLTLEPPARLIEALALAGGPGEYADKSRIFVLRQFPNLQRIRFTYDAVVHDEGGAAGFPLRTGDVIVVE